MTVDNHVGSPFQDRIYVTWTTFAADGTAYIYEAYSSDYGEHFSARSSSARPAALRQHLRTADAAGELQREPVLAAVHRAPDGTLYVVVGQLQQRRHWLRTTATRCCWRSRPTAAPPSALRSRSATTTTCPTARPTRAGADPGRACVPRRATTNSIFRAANYPSGAVNPTNPSQVVVTFGSYINRYSKESNGCVPTGFAGQRQQPRTPA